jgi:hypothetical protein
MCGSSEKQVAIQFGQNGQGDITLNPVGKHCASSSGCKGTCKAMQAINLMEILQSSGANQLSANSKTSQNNYTQ